MTLDSLIEQLAENLVPVRSRRLWLEASVLAIIALAELALLLAVGIGRMDVRRMLTEPTMSLRLASLGLIALVSSYLAVRSFDPTYSAKSPLRWLVLVIVICGVLGTVMGGIPAGAVYIVHRLNWVSGTQCASKIVLLSVPLLVALAVLGRRGAPTDMRRTPVLIGLASAAWGAFVFVFACPFNDALYIVFWYGGGCGIVTLVSRLLLPRFLRW